MAVDAYFTVCFQRAMLALHAERATIVIGNLDISFVAHEIDAASKTRFISVMSCRAIAATYDWFHLVLRIA